MELFRLFAMLLAIASLIAAVLGLGGAFNDALDVINHFAPLTLGAATIAAGIQGALGPTREKATLTCALLAMAILIAFMVPEYVAKVVQSHVAPRGQTIKVIEMNLWSENVDPAGTARWLAAQHADVLILEEVVAAGYPVPDLVKTVYPYRTHCEPDVPCTTFILSRRPPRAGGVYPSPDSSGLHSAAWATFGAGPSAYTVIGDHALWPRPSQHQQSQTALLAARFAAFDRNSLIVAGDFNSTPWSFSLRRQDALFGLERRTRALFSFPVRTYSRYRLWTPVPILPIDHIYAGKGWRTVSVRLGPRLGSDHLPTVAVLTR